MCEAGIAATTLNYLWPLSFMLFSFIPYKKIYYNEKINKKSLPFYIIAIIYSCNQEQCVCIILAVSFIFFLYSIKNNKAKWYSILLLLISLLSLIIIINCPGNSIRAISEMSVWYPDYINANFLDKIILSVISTSSIIISYFFVIDILSYILFILVMKKVKKIIPKILGFSQLVLFICLSLLRIYSVIFRKKIIIFDYYTNVGHIININTIFTFIISLSVIIIITLLIGYGTRLMMGFSPTIFASRNRTAIFLYFSLILIIIYFFNKYKELFGNKEKKLIFIVIFLFILGNFGLLFLKTIY